MDKQVDAMLEKALRESFDEHIQQVRRARLELFRSDAVIDPSGPGIDSFCRMDAVLHNHRRLPRLEWFEQLGDQWTCCDNLASHRSVLRIILRGASRAELDAMMTLDERAALARSAGKDRGLARLLSSESTRRVVDY